MLAKRAKKPDRSQQENLLNAEMQGAYCLASFLPPFDQQVGRSVEWVDVDASFASTIEAAQGVTAIEQEAVERFRAFIEHDAGIAAAPRIRRALRELLRIFDGLDWEKEVPSTHPHLYQNRKSAHKRSDPIKARALELYRSGKYGRKKSGHDGSGAAEQIRDALRKEFPDSEFAQKLRVERVRHWLKGVVPAWSGDSTVSRAKRG